MSVHRDSAIDLSGRRIVVTGAAGGIGSATAARLARAGARIALLDRSEATLRPLAEELGMPAFARDVADAAAIERTARRVEERLGGVDGLVNAAGVLLLKTIEEMSGEEWLRVTNVNLLGPFLVSKVFAPALRGAGRSTIVNIASIGGLRPAKAVSAYAASKAGLMMLSKCLAVELAPHVRVNTVCPGTIETAMAEELLSDPAVRERLTTSPALGRLARADDIADAILYLSSDLSAYVNGATLVADGGYSWA